MKRYKQDCLKPYIESTHETMIEHKDSDWVSHEDMPNAMNRLIDELWSDLHEVDKEQLIKEAMEQC